MGRGKQQRALGTGLLYGQRRPPTSLQEVSSAPALTLERARRRLFKLGFAPDREEQEVGALMLDLPSKLRPFMADASVTIYAHPLEKEIRLVLWPEWHSEPPALASPAMQTFARQLVRAGLGELMIEFACNRQRLAVVEDLVGADSIHLVAPENTEDARREEEVLDDYCRHIGVERQGGSSLGQLLLRDRVGGEQLFAHYGDLMLTVSATALAR